MGLRTLKRSSLKQWNRKREESESEDRGNSLNWISNGNIVCDKNDENFHFKLLLVLAEDFERIFTRKRYLDPIHQHQTLSKTHSFRFSSSIRPEDR